MEILVSNTSTELDIISEKIFSMLTKKNSTKIMQDMFLIGYNAQAIVFATKLQQ